MNTVVSQASKVSANSYLNVSGDRLLLSSPYDTRLVEDCRNVPGRRWDSVNKLNTFPLTSIRPVLQLCAKWGIKTDPLVDGISDSEPVQAEEQLGVEITNGRVIIRFGYSPDMILSLKRIVPGVSWKQKDAHWTTSPNDVGLAIKFAHQWGLTIQDGIEAAHEAEMQRAQEMHEASHSLHSDLHVESAIELLPYQKAGVQYIVKARRAILADEQGLGKSPQSLAAVVNEGMLPMVVISPATVKPNWAQVEIPKFFPDLTVTVVDGRSPTPIAPADVIIVNYDICAARAQDIIDLKPRTLVADEAHRIRNGKAVYRCPQCDMKVRVNSKSCKRAHRFDKPVETWTNQLTQGTMEIARAIPDDGFIFALTGTPAVNRPADFMPLLVLIDRIDLFGGRWKFLGRYADGKQAEELNRRLRENCMIRRTKLDVWQELPPLRNAKQLMVIDPALMRQYQEIENDVVEHLALRAKELAEEAGEDGADAYWEKRMRAETAEHLVRISVLRNAAAEIKMQAVVNWIQNFLDGSEDEKLVVFAEHVNMVEELAAHFGDQAVKIRGGVSSQARADAVERFQTDPECRLFVGNLQAAGEGITLTAASNVAFVELDWKYASHSQAISRCYGRANDLHGAVAWWLLAPRTIDTDMLELLLQKQDVISRVTDGVNSDQNKSILGDLLVGLTKRGLTRMAEADRITTCSSNPKQSSENSNLTVALGPSLLGGPARYCQNER